MPGIDETLGSAVLGAIPVAGAIGSAALQQKYALRNWERQNQYNSPKSQVQRLKEAGLPLATMFGGQGGSTSESIPTPNVDSTLGAAEGIQKGMLFTMQKKQMELLDQQIREKTADADIRGLERDFLSERTIDSSTGKDDRKDFEPQFGDSNFVQGERRKRAMQEAQLQGSRIVNGLKQIELDNAPEQIRAQIDDVLTRIGRGQLEIKRDQEYYNMLDQIAKDMKQGGTGWEGIKRLITAWFYKMAVR